MTTITSAAKGIVLKTTATPHDLVFEDLATVWDEAMPMGNGEVGALVWQKGKHLRIALDRSDLWDLRPMPIYKGKEFTFDWIYNQVLKRDYAPVLHHYSSGSNSPGPTKIPGAALEIDISDFGELKENHLFLNQAVTRLEWKDGKRMDFFVYANAPLGWFVLQNYDKPIDITMVPPMYEAVSTSNVVDWSPSDLAILGYKKGNVVKSENKIEYVQQCWGDLSYEVAVKWEKMGNMTVGVWSITSSESAMKATEIVDRALRKGVKDYYASHCEWWDDFYSKSSIDIPDTLLAKQYFNEVYKMGSLARANCNPIALQGVWTADNGRMAPWHGDYHHDLNTQLTYWPFYTANHLEEESGFLNTLWNQRDYHRQYTKTFFGVNGLNVPGICSLKGAPMGTWIQYTFNPTVSSWLGHHFYLHWKYSQDRKFLEEKGYPYLKEVATFLENFMVMKDGVRVLPLSSSPEFFDNSLRAWFLQMTNFDRALVKFAFSAAAEMANELNLTAEAKHWEEITHQLPELVVHEDGDLMIAPGVRYNTSHRHFSHMMAIHPLGLIDKSHGAADSRIVDQSIASLEKYGSAWWCGYSFSWLGSFMARALNGEGAAEALRTFASNFCLRNTFHANGDQKKEGKSNFTYRPFTLEGNFAFAAGIQEMLLQSHTGVINVFPAVPNDWRNVSFKQLRAVGAFIVTASKENGKVSEVEIFAEKGGLMKLRVPENAQYKFHGKAKRVIMDNGVLKIQTRKGEKLKFSFS